MRFWNPESGEQITAEMINNLTDSNKEEDQKVFILLSTVCCRLESLKLREMKEKINKGKLT